MKRLVTLVVWVLSTYLAFAQTSEPKIVVNAPFTAIAGEKFTVDFSISFDAITFNEEIKVDFLCPYIDGATILSRSTSKSSSMRVVDGKMLKDCTYTYSLIIYFKEVGNFNINNASFVVNNNTYTPQPFSIEITPNFMGDTHLKFRGIPINGGLEDFCESLSQLEYVRNTYHVREGDRSAALTGRYGGVDCTIYVYCTVLTNTVYGVQVCLEGGTWDETLKLYNRFRTLLTEKHGPAVRVINNIEEFEGNELTSIASEEAKVFSLFYDKSPDLGDISLLIWSAKNEYALFPASYKGVVVIEFQDHSNSELAQKEVLDSL